MIQYSWNGASRWDSYSDDALVRITKRSLNQRHVKGAVAELELRKTRPRGRVNLSIVKT